ncbi:MAG: UDP-N-acetylglucosamine 2-epimerase (hydrolyzing) [Patescibacteria group bacterium]|nr:UDP-N-acetylglucosamine 2-epimerase (hydrolyzing) [Patescibacteria group bacterium]
MSSSPRKIAVVITNRAPYGRLKPVMRAIVARPDLKLKIIVGIPVASKRLLFGLKHSTFRSLKESLPWLIRARIKTFVHGGDVSRFELLPKLIRSDGFHIDRYLPMFLEGGDLQTMLKVQGSVLFELPAILKELKPDVLLVHADRYEMLPVAMAAATLNIPVAHTQGGDVSGTFDETVRHAITKIAHIHFPTTDKSKQRLIQMGEDPRYVIMTGCPTMDVLKDLDLTIDGGIWERNGKGFGDHIDFSKPYALVLQHPVTSEYVQSRNNMEELLAALEQIRMPTLLFGPNIDGGTDGSTAAVREFTKHHTLPVLCIYKTFNAEDFYRVLNDAAVAVGNSSSFIREGSYLGTPAVVVGTRQQERERADNVVDAGYDRTEIEKAMRAQLAHGRYPQSNLYGDGHTSERIAEALATMPLPSMQKIFHTRP